MGEFAGYALDEVANHEDDILDWKLGQITAWRAYDLGIIDEQGFENRPAARTNFTCRYCNRGGMLWKHTSRGFRLFDGDAMHSCGAYFKR